MTASCSPSWPPAWCSAAATSASPTGRARPPRCAADATSGSPPGSSTGCASVLAAYERLIGLDLADVSVDGCLTKAPCGGECAGRSPVDRAKPGLKRSQLADGSGVPLTALPAPANIRDHLLLPATLDVLAGLLEQVGADPHETTVHLDAGYDYRPCRAELADRGLGSQISQRGKPAPVQVGKRWVIERTNSWLNDYGRLRRCTERRRCCVEAYLALAAAIVTLRALLRAAWYRYRWDGRPRSPRIR